MISGYPDWHGIESLAFAVGPSPTYDIIVGGKSLSYLTDEGFVYYVNTEQCRIEWKLDFRDQDEGIVAVDFAPSSTNRIMAVGYSFLQGLTVYQIDNAYPLKTESARMTPLVSVSLAESFLSMYMVSSESIFLVTDARIMYLDPTGVYT